MYRKFGNLELAKHPTDIINKNVLSHQKVCVEAAVVLQPYILVR